MTDDTERLTPPPRRRPTGTLSLDERLGGIEDKQDEILDALNKGSTSFATLHLRVRAIEIIIYSGCSITLIGVVGALLYQVIKGGPAGHP